MKLRTHNARRSIVGAVAIAAAVAVGATTMTPPTASAAKAPPTYRIEAVKFKVIDETNPEWAGSDEIYWVFDSVGAPGQTTNNHTHTFTDLDDGNVRNFDPAKAERCIFGDVARNCAARPAGPLGIGVHIVEYEEDHGNKSKEINAVHTGFNAVALGVSLAGYPAIAAVIKAAGDAVDFVLGILGFPDDRLKSREISYTPERLASLTKAGQSFTEVISFNPKGDGNSDLTVKVTRVT